MDFAVIVVIFASTIQFRSAVRITLWNNTIITHSATELSDQQLQQKRKRKLLQNRACARNTHIILLIKSAMHVSICSRNDMEFESHWQAAKNAKKKQQEWNPVRAVQERKKEWREKHTTVRFVLTHSLQWVMSVYESCLFDCLQIVGLYCRLWCRHHDRCRHCHRHHCHHLHYHCSTHAAEYVLFPSISYVWWLVRWGLLPLSSTLNLTLPIINESEYIACNHALL